MVPMGTSVHLSAFAESASDAGVEVSICRLSNPASVLESALPACTTVSTCVKSSALVPATSAGAASGTTDPVGSSTPFSRVQKTAYVYSFIKYE